MFTEERMAVRDATRNWWVFLASGIAWQAMRYRARRLAKMAA